MIVYRCYSIRLIKHKSLKGNPFLFEKFTNTWLKHFNANQTAHSFNFIKGLGFLKHKILPIYTNVGKNNTNGISYSLNDLNLFKDYKNKVFLIYDVPTYFDIHPSKNKLNLKINAINQYKGVLIDISKYKSFEDLLQNKFRAKTRYKLRKKEKELEKNFSITYSVYDDKITNEEYDFIAKHFKLIIAKRFDSLKKHNRIVNSWDYYYDLMLPMLKSQKAIIVTVNKDNVPIGITFNLLSASVLFYAISTFDIDYLKYGIGHITIIQILKWCFENDYKVLDFSKGENEYKSKWMTNDYHFQNHILYDSNSFSSTLIAKAISTYFKFKQFLRDQNINMLYTKIKFLFKKNSAKSKKATIMATSLDN